MSRASSSWQPGGSRVNASRSAACRSAASSSCSAVAVWVSGMFSAAETRSQAHEVPMTRSTRPHSRRAVVEGQPDSAARSRILSSWSTSFSQTAWATSSASVPPSRYRRQIGPDQRNVPLDQHLPGPFVAIPGPGHQVNDHLIITHRVSARPRHTAAAAGGSGTPVLPGGMRDRNRESGLAGAGTALRASAAMIPMATLPAVVDTTRPPYYEEMPQVPSADGRLLGARRQQRCDANQHVLGIPSARLQRVD
jgi:hypothetical protein